MLKEKTNHIFIVDLSVPTDAIKHGATGFLYGLGQDGIPSINMLTPIKPQIAAQKPEGGLQHPNGDALSVANSYKIAGGKEIEIYLQDIYQNWPYEMLGLEDYSSRVVQVINQVVESPLCDLFSFVPFNEPDQIWYDKHDKKEAFFFDWNNLYRKIKSIHPTARIVGPNFAAYDSACYKDFLSFTKDHQCIPDVISWHELNDDFFPFWYSHYEDYRRIESVLGISAREICINEYCRSSGDLGIPGKLIQWITRFENSKVDACLAYWMDAGSLNNLVTRDNYNKATGAWWLYHCYGKMSGNTVKTIPPQPNAEGLQGLASVDSAKKQAYILLGGCDGNIRIRISGFETISHFQDEVHVAVWAIKNSGFEPSSDPIMIIENNYAIINHQLTFEIKNREVTSAYYIVLTPAKASKYLRHAYFYAAEYAEISGSAKIVYPQSSYELNSPYIEILCDGKASTKFVVTAVENGYYMVRLTYAAGPSQAAFKSKRITIKLNGSWLTDIAIPKTPNWNTWQQSEINIFLTAGINQIDLTAVDDLDQSEIHIRSLEISSVEGPIRIFQGEDSQNSLTGAATIVEDANASGCKFVGEIGDGEANALEFNHIHVPDSGMYRMVVYYANAEFRGGHAYNSQIVDRYADICVNDSNSQRVYFRNTFAWDNYQSRVVDVFLQSGINTIRFFNRDFGAFCPHIDKIEIVAPVF